MPRPFHSEGARDRNSSNRRTRRSSRKRARSLPGQTARCMRACQPRAKLPPRGHPWRQAHLGPGLDSPHCCKQIHNKSRSGTAPGRPARIITKHVSPLTFAKQWARKPKLPSLSWQRIELIAPHANFSPTGQYRGILYPIERPAAETSPRDSGCPSHISPQGHTREPENNHAPIGRSRNGGDVARRRPANFRWSSR